MRTMHATTETAMLRMSETIRLTGGTIMQGATAEPSAAFYCGKSTARRVARPNVLSFPAIAMRNQRRVVQVEAHRLQSGARAFRGGRAHAHAKLALAPECRGGLTPS